MCEVSLDFENKPWYLGTTKENEARFLPFQKFS